MRTFVFFIVLFFATRALAQDSIFFRNGGIEAVKVTEVKPKTVHYYISGASSPLYIVHKNEIEKIKYSTGHVEFFKAPDKNVEKQAMSDSLMFRNRLLIYHFQPLSSAALSELIDRYPYPETKERMRSDLLLMKDLKKKQYRFGFGGAAAGLLCFATCAIIGTPGITPNPDVQGVTTVGGLFLGAAVFVAGEMISLKFRKKRTAAEIRIKDAYNRMQ